MVPEPVIASPLAGPGLWMETLLGLAYPPVCALCHERRAGPREGHVCGLCRLGVRTITEPCCQRCGTPFGGEIIGAHTCTACRSGSPSWDEARAAVVAEGAVLECIHRLKYQREPWFATFLSGLLAEAAAPRLAGHRWEGLVPVPLHPVRRREREFNQAELLARPLATALGLPLRTDLVRRREPTLSQASLSRDERIRNMRSAFEPAHGGRIRGAWIVVDDVLTTGATTDGVATVLKTLGATRVVVWAVARATLESAGSGWAGPDQSARRPSDHT